jgi:threonine dehydratase
MGLEILEDLPDVAAVAVPIGGGGMISGVSTAVKGLAPQVRTIGVEPAGAPRYSVSRAAGKPMELDKVDTIADGTRTDHANPDNFEMIQARVDELCTVEDEFIRKAMYLLMTKAKITVEPSGALPVAAALAGKLPVEKGQKVAFVLSGGNVDPKLAAEILANG